MDWRIGCCGFAKGRAAYFSAFDVVEVQQTFYKLPKPDLASVWRNQSPARAEFVLKAPQLITHAPSSPTYRRLGEKIPLDKQGAYGYFRPTREVRAARRHIEHMATALRSHLLLYQCPPSFGPTREHIANLRGFFRRKSPVPCALELRGKGWTDKIISELCTELDVIPVVDPLLREPLTVPHTGYFRLHGMPAYHYSYPYSPADLAKLYDLLAQLPISTCYVLFNNFTMFKDAQDFATLCSMRQRLTP